MTSTAAMRCPVCGGHLSVGGATLVSMTDEWSRVTIMHAVECDQCEKEYRLMTSCRPESVRLLQRNADVVLAVDDRRGSPRGGTGSMARLFRKIYIVVRFYY